MKKYGLVGCGIGGSLSPVLFGAAYPGVRYDLIDTDSFDRAAGVLADGYAAVNVTAPFKEEAFRFARVTDAVSRRIGAVNILVRTDDGFAGYNSDYLAVRKMLELHLPTGGGTVLVVGCGGAGRAAAVAASDCGYHTVVANRSFEKAAEFCSKAGGMSAIPLRDIPGLLGISSAVIYTLPVCIQEAVAISSRKSIVKMEASYLSPSLGGDNYVGGRQWLAWQAVTGYGIMTGEAPDSGAVWSVAGIG